jgi:hypothetical protein
MKNEKEESPKQLPTELGSAEIYDFIYVDRARISSLYTQLFPQGLLTTVKTTSQQIFSDVKHLGTDIKVIKAEAQSAEGGVEGIEHMFDASWSVPLEVLSRLQALSIIRGSLRDAALGSIVLAEGFLRVIDYAGMKDLWEPIMRMAGRSLPKGKNSQGLKPSEIVEIMKGVPQSIHAQFLTSEGFLWSSLRPSDLVIPADDLVLKHGGAISGKWKILYILDAYADEGKPPDVSGWSGGELTNGILSAMHGIRAALGRPPRWFGITPLMIFRVVNPTLQPNVTETSAETPIVTRTDGGATARQE